MQGDGILLLRLHYISSQDFLDHQRNIFSDYEMCIYLQYENEPDGVAYTRTVLGNVVTTGSFGGRSLGIVLLKNESFIFSDSASKLLLLMRALFSPVDFSEEFERKVLYKRLMDSGVDDREEIRRSLESYRSFSDEVEFEALPFASRLFFRTVQTVTTLLDWLRGKICEANNVVTFYCTVDLEIKFRCKL